MQIIFVLLFLTLLFTQSLHPNYRDPEDTISGWFERKKYVMPFFSRNFVWSEKQIACTDDKILINTHANFKPYIIDVALDEFKGECLYIEEEINKHNHIIIKAIIQSNYNGLLDPFILKGNLTLVRSYKTITTLETLIRNFNNEIKYLASLKNKTYLTEKDILRISRSLVGDTKVEDTNKNLEKVCLLTLNPITGIRTSHLYSSQGEEYRILCNHYKWKNKDSISCKLGFRQNSPCYKPSCGNPSGEYYSIYGPWYHFPKVASDLILNKVVQRRRNKVIQCKLNKFVQLDNNLSHYNIDDDPRVKMLPANASDKEKRKALYQNPFEKKWEPIKQLLTIEP